MSELAVKSADYLDLYLPSLLCSMKGVKQQKEEQSFLPLILENWIALVTISSPNANELHKLFSFLIEF